MPLYEYKCDSCGATFELIQRFSDPPVVVCRVCGAPVHKVLSAPAIRFKGSGWYVTDYPKKGMTDAGKSTNGTSSSTTDSAKSSDASASTPASTPTDSAKKAENA
jgi:putative FmdB family regulatory protein